MSRFEERPQDASYGAQLTWPPHATLTPPLTDGEVDDDNNTYAQEGDRDVRLWSRDLRRFP
jgi:hypothetical protein